ncbi:MAG: hypothetical protein V1769_04805 [Thermoplasmatota archaeon]
MFEKRTKKQRTMIYLVIAGLVTLALATMHYFQYSTWMPAAMLIGISIIEFLCIFYILYLPLKMKKE